VKILIIFFLTILALPLNAENSNKTELLIDSSKIEVRKPSENSIAKFKLSKDFLYNEAKSENWWEAFWLWVNNKLSKLLGTKAFGFIQKYLGYIIVLAAVIIVILVLNKSKFAGLFYSNDGKLEKFKEIKENINEMNFEALIPEAISKREYRIAVRLQYLQTLRFLADKKLIDWNANKTNQNYAKEIKENDLRKPFEELTYLFEWIWYGEFSIEKFLFEETENNFKKFQQRLAIE
jgi:Domain of unknown function (DUF4129)